MKEHIHKYRVGIPSRSKRVRIRLKVKEVAMSKGISKTKLSRISDTNYGTLNAIWNGRTNDILLTTLLRIARALKVDHTALYTIEDDE